MAEKSPKPFLPDGWVAKVSKHYPDRIYYFDMNTGVSIWDTELDPPRIQSNEKDKVADLHHKITPEVCNKSAECSSQSRNDTTVKSSVPPTAIVVPVMQEQKKLHCPVPVPGKKTIHLKRRRDSLLEDSFNKAETSKLKQKESPVKRKNISPLNNPDLKDSLPQENVKKNRSKKICKNEISGDAVAVLPATCESSAKDVEMQDVSADLMDDLTEMKETVFDTTACYYIVLDTNVLIGELHLVSELKDTPLDGCGPPHIFIPWVVIEELDKLKSSRTSKACASAAAEAIRYLNSVLGNHPRFHGQTPIEAEVWAKTYSKCNDDKILECCMGLCGKMPAEKVILLTNDTNLSNKAKICKLNVHNFESMMKKVKPDTRFDCEEMKLARKKKKEKESETSKSPCLPSETREERILQSRRDICKGEIHTVMSNVRLLLKDVLLSFFTDRMSEAYGNNVWVHFGVETNLLKGLIGGIIRYWKFVFYEDFSEKSKCDFELLLEKAERPVGFLGDRMDCLKILSTVESIFKVIAPQQVKQIKDYRLAISCAFESYCEAESAFQTAEENSIRTLLDDNWTIINQMCGIILDHYEVPHDFDYFGKGKRYSNFEIERIMVILYPAVKEIKNLLCKTLDAVKCGQPLRTCTKKLAAVLLNLIPSLQLPAESRTYPFFNSKALERWFASPQNRQRIEAGIKQIEIFFSKLEEAYLAIMRPSIVTSPENKMICD